MIPAERAHVHVAAQTHPGMSGKNNEDRFAVTALRIDGERPLPVVLAVVSDGIGGHRAGEVAAETAVETISRVVAASDGTRPVETLHQAVQQASQAILEQSQEDLGKHGMGATCACALIIDNRLFIASVGDSRIFLLRGERIRQLSIDHTWIQEALDAGMLTPEQAKGHPNAHVIRRYLGSPQPVEPDLRLRLTDDEDDVQRMANQGMPLEPCDQIILCSDGLTDLVSPEEIRDTLKNNDQQKALQILTEMANQRGGHDNITIVALQYPTTMLETTPTVPRPQARRAPRLALSWTSCLTVLIGAVLLTAVLAGGYLFLTGASLLGDDPTATPTISPTLTVTSRTPTATRRATASTTPAPTGSIWVTVTPNGASTSAPTGASTPGTGTGTVSPPATITPWRTNTPGP
jgi:protein phosphatase